MIRYRLVWLVLLILISFGASPAQAQTTGSITILKNVDDDDFSDMDFDFTFDGQTPFSISEDDTVGFVANDLPAGSYPVTETVPEDWDLISIDCGSGNNNTALTDGVTIVLEAGEDAVCTFNNNYEPPMANVTIVKEVTGNDLPDVIPDFRFNYNSSFLVPNLDTADPDDMIEFQTGRADFLTPVFLTDGEDSGDFFTNLPNGRLVITEASPPENWSLASLECEATAGAVRYIGGSPSSGVLDLSIQSGDDITCTFTNEYAPAPDTYELRLIKYNDLNQNGQNDELNTGAGDDPSGNALIGWEFVVYDSQGNEVGRNTTSVENAGANGDLGIRASIPGLISGEEYTICETQQEDWINTEPGTIDPTYGEPCETVTLTSSTTATRYFGNYENVGSLEVTKVVDWNGVTPDENQTFEICIRGASYPNGDEGFFRGLCG